MRRDRGGEGGREGRWEGRRVGGRAIWEDNMLGFRKWK